MLSTMFLNSVLHWTCLSVSLLTLSLPFTWGQTNLLPSDFDPNRQFCFRYGHQSAVIDNRLYIDGGYLSLSNPDPTGTRDNTSYAYPGLSFHELSTTTRNGTELGQPPLITSLSSKPSNVPHVSQGALWSDTVNKKLYLYGGQTTYDGEESPPANIWMYDAFSDEWEVMNDTSGKGYPVRLYRGASAVADNLGLAYYMGGWVDDGLERGSERNTSIVAGLLIYDMVQNTWRNESIPNNEARAEGSMVYVPIGESGSLVYFGGVRSPDGTYGSLVGVSMLEIHVYDIASGKWYLQYASGQVPSSRRQICSDVSITRGRDGSPVYNIYMYGGASGKYNETIQSGWDQVYVLSLPSFVWTRFWPTGSANPRPRYGHTCNVFNNAQMLVVGGDFPQGGQCDAPNQAGVHTLNLGGSEAAGTVWTDFDPSKMNYTIPAVVQQSVDGITPNWTHPDLLGIFSKTAQQPARTPTRALPDTTLPPAITDDTQTEDPSRTRIIIALAISIPVFLITAGGMIWRMAYYRYKNQQAQNATFNPPPSGSPYKNFGFERPIESHNGNSNDYKEVQRPTSMIGQAGLEPDRQTHTYAHGASATYPPNGPLPIAYIRDPITGGLTPVYDRLTAATAENVVMPEELPAFRSSAELVEAGWQEGSVPTHELNAGRDNIKPLPELPGSIYR
ncbi:hypothetical protein ABW21_db0204013 [Orbilia brochopaga]|nr:hypothetical protein ABW21_db0204013 [Drechslerella brochopaga]